MPGAAGEQELRAVAQVALHQPQRAARQRVRLLPYRRRRSRHVTMRWPLPGHDAGQGLQQGLREHRARDALPLRRRAR
jgi:hypothetical protein